MDKCPKCGSDTFEAGEMTTCRKCAWMVWNDPLEELREELRGLKREVLLLRGELKGLGARHELLRTYVAKECPQLRSKFCLVSREEQFANRHL